jgi:ElaB/YqjD/DUF883 family membrane-anchored ribosome-binding protein
MIRNLLFWSIILITAILVYNRFWGDSSDKERSQKVFGEAKELFHSVADVVKSEKQKVESGRYDQALGNIRNLFEKMRSSADDNKDVIDQIDVLEEKRKSIEERLDKIRSMPDDNTSAAVSKQSTGPTTQEANQLKSEMDELLRQTSDLINQIEKDQEKE